MKTRLYILLIPFTLSLIAAGILVHLALQNGLAIQWVAAACSGLTALLLLCQTVVSPSNLRAGEEPLTQAESPRDF